MVIEVQEPEMIERYSQSLKRAASHAKEFMTAPENRKPQLFVEFISELKVAAGSAHQLAIYQENPHWLSMRDTLEGVIEVSQHPVVFSTKQNGLWLNIKQSLDRLAENGLRMARSKAMTRTDVLANLVVREGRIRTESQDV